MDGLDPVIMTSTAAAVAAVVQILKGAGLPDRWAGIAALMVGLVVGPLLQLAGMGGGTTAAATVAGMFAGFTAAGVYSAGKAAVKG